MKLKQIFLILAAIFLVIAGCADDSDDDSTSWTEIFNDDFNRADSNYVEGDPAKDSLGSKYRAYSQDADGNIEITSNTVTTDTSAIAEYQTPMTEETVKLTVKFNSDSFPIVLQNGVYLGDAVSTGSGCQVMAGYFSDGTNYALHVLDKDTATSLASDAITLTTGTQYTLEMFINDGAVTVTIKDASGTTLATATASAATSSNKYLNCLMVEPSFVMKLAGNVIFDDFTISTGD